MEKLKLSNGKTYALSVNGVRNTGKGYKFIIIPGEETFDQVEAQFTNEANTATIHILNDLDSPVQSIVGHTKYKGMEKILDYQTSSDLTTTVMIVYMAEPDIEERVKMLESDVMNTMIALTEIYEGGVI